MYRSHNYTRWGFSLVFATYCYVKRGPFVLAIPVSWSPTTTVTPKSQKAKSSRTSSLSCPRCAIGRPGTCLLLQRRTHLCRTELGDFRALARNPTICADVRRRKKNRLKTT